MKVDFGSQGHSNIKLILQADVNLFKVWNFPMLFLNFSVISAWREFSTGAHASVSITITHTMLIY
jgi:hypothetical protein